MGALEALLSDLEGDMECEAEGHEDGFVRHDDGPGRWYVVTKCPGCLHVKTELVCDGYFVWMIARWKIDVLQCFECYKWYAAEDYWAGSEERK